LCSYLFGLYIFIGRREKCGVKFIKKAVKPFTDKRLSLPSESLSLPTITITDKKITIEQHYQLISFTETEIKLRCNNGIIQINGASLIIKLMYPREIILEGSINKVSFHH